MTSLPDIQKTSPSISRHIPWVGINNFKYPVPIKTSDGDIVKCPANFSLLCSLDKNYKGIHMSRFVEVINDIITESDDKWFILIAKEIAQRIKDRMNSDKVLLSVEFDYFINCKSPVSEKFSYLPIKSLIYIFMTTNKELLLYGSIVSYTSLCPCSKEISKYGAHNQRSYATVLIYHPNKIVMFEDIVKWVNNCASAPIHELLKREDEKWVTEKAYENPVFVEDMVRMLEDIVIKEGCTEYWIKVEHYESIHVHNAVAFTHSQNDFLNSLVGFV